MADGLTSLSQILDRLLGTVRPESINALLQQISKRAERLDTKQQAETFVSLGGIENTLLSQDNRVIFGRRGTGKTHVMSFVADRARVNGQIGILIDLRTIGSNSYLYQNQDRSLADRATLLLRDFVTALHDGLLEEITDPQKSYKITRFSQLLDGLGNSVREVIVTEVIEIEGKREGSSQSSAGSELGFEASPITAKATGKANFEGVRRQGASSGHSKSGKPRLSVNIGQVYRALAEIGERLGNRIWVLVDEWSTVPEDLQPYLADFLKRVLFPNKNFTVQIAAIQHRSRFRVGLGANDVGIELGSDAAADINLDDYLVYENGPEKSKAFFQEMIFRHALSVAKTKDPKLKNSNEFIRNTFAQEPVFNELVRACEGVPRDAINILQLAAIRAQENKIATAHIRSAARDWYDRDKSAFVSTGEEASALLHWIIEDTIGKRKARAFLTQSDVKNETLEQLFDERIVHIAKKSYSTKEHPGVRYKVWKLDYGCYVDLINTSKAPTGFLLEGVDFTQDADIVVPEDDFRSVRRSILNLDEFYASRKRAAAIQ